MHMINIRRAFAGITAGFIVLFTATTPSAQATTHPNPRVTVDLRQLPTGDCWYEVSWLNRAHTQTNVEPVCAPPKHHTPTICTTGHRDHGTYNRECLTTGTPKTAARMWNTVPTGKPDHLRDDMTTQRNLCAYAPRHGGVMAWARELVGDMTYDNYRNNEQVNRWVGQDATLTCAQLGYRI